MRKIAYILTLVLLIGVVGAAFARTLFGNNYSIHRVQKDESLYSIAKTNRWNIDTLNKLNPTVAAGIQKGQEVWYPVVGEDYAESSAGEPAADTIKYVMGYGETLYDIAHRNNMDVADRFRLNPTLTEENATGGRVISIQPNSRLANAVQSIDSIRRVAYVNQHRVERGETWFGIAQNNDIDMVTLIEANGYTAENAPLKTGAYVSVPHFETVAVTRYSVPQRDRREMTPSGRMAIYDSVHNSHSFSSDALNIAILVSTKSNFRRDAEFLKGWMLATDSVKNNGQKIRISVYDLSGDSIKNLAKLIENGTLNDKDVIISTDEKNFPKQLNQFGKESGKYVINPFDLYDDSYLNNSSVALMLSPTPLFYRRIADVSVDNNPDQTFIFVGDKSEQEQETLDGLIKQRLDNAGRKYYSVSNIADLATLKLPKEGEYSLIPTASKRSEVEAFLKAAIDLKERLPGAEISVIGRPSWIQYIDRYQEDMSRVNTFIPSRFYADEESYQVKEFNTKFKEVYGHKPQHAWPIFSYFGFDLGMWIMGSPKKGDYKLPVYSVNPISLQTDFEMQQIKDGGLANTAAYFIHISAGGNIDVIKVNTLE